tara:strand:- start:1119 stop:2012 length:894 start_codon:yes stop_codon:yes gene_type:complete
MQILITGGKGFLAGRISNYLKKKRLNIILCSRNKTKGLSKIDWNSPKNLNNLCKKVDVIINCAGLDSHRSKSIKEAKKVNSVYPLNLFKAASKNKVKLFIFLSTFHVYKTKNLINELTHLNKNSIYTLSKINGEKNLLQEKSSNTKVLILRVCNLFGYPFYKNKNCWNLLINSIVKDLITKNKFKIKSSRNEYRNYSSIKSFCEFIYSIINKIDRKNEIPKIINYCSELNVNITEIVKIIVKSINDKRNKILFKYPNIKKTNKIFFRSKYQNKFKNIRDKYFKEEMRNLISYSKTFF